MDDFEFWSPKLNLMYDDAIAFIQANVEKKSSAKIIITGQANIGKTAFTEKVLGKIWINRDLDKNIGQIIKVHFDDFLFINHLKQKKKSVFWDTLSFIEPTISIPVGPIETSINLNSALKKYFLPEKITILWFENVTKYDSLSIEKVLSIINDYENFPTISIITTQNNSVRTSLKKFDPTAKSFNMPKITQRDFLDYKNAPPENPEAQTSELLDKLIFLNSTKKAKNAIKLGQGAYGNIEQLISLFQNDLLSDTVEIHKLIEAIFDIKTSNDGDEKNKLLMNLFIFPEGVSWDWLEELFKNSRFDYVGALDNLLQNQLIVKKNNRFMINKNLPIEQVEYLSFYENKREVRSSAKALDLLLKNEFPEKYFVRAETATLFDKNLADTYRFIYILRSSRSSNYSNQKAFTNKKNLKALLNLLTTSLEVEKETTKKDQWLRKIEKQLDSVKEHELPLLILAEHSYFKLKLLLAYSYDLRKKIHPQIEIQLQRMIHIFDDLIKNNEAEMAIKLGLLVAPEIINYMSHEDVSEAKQIYKQVERMLYSFLKKNRHYYQAYDIVCKFVSTSILSYRKANGNLWDLVKEFQSSNSKLLINYSDLFPMLFSNLLGMSFYLGYSEMEAALALYKKNKATIDSFKQKKYKVTNNLQLALLLKTGSTKKNVQKFLLPFHELRKNHVSTINYAGVLFYSKQYDEAREIIEELHKIEERDDFYIFFCEYNSALIDYAKKDIEKDKIINKLTNLEIPSLFTDKPTFKRFERRLRFLIQAIKNNYETDIIKLEKEVINHVKEPVPIFNKLWLFSDYQYWS